MTAIATAKPDLASSCIGKKRYNGPEHAERVATHVLRVRGTALRVYLCEACAGYHLTKRDAPRPPEPKPGWHRAKLPRSELERHRRRARRGR
jgi:hypothetical protein